MGSSSSWEIFKKYAIPILWILSIYTLYSHPLKKDLEGGLYTSYPSATGLRLDYQ